MRGILTTLLFVAIAAGQGGKHKDPDERVLLEIDGNKHELVAGQRSEIQIGEQKVSVRVSPIEHRVVDTKWFSFEFPRRYHFSYDAEDGIPAWNVEGAVSFVQVVKADETTVKEALDIYSDGLRGNVKPKPARLKLGKLNLKGLRLDDTEDPEALGRTLLFAFERNKQVWVVVVYDSPEDNGKMSAECKKAYDLMRKSFKMKK